MKRISVRTDNAAHVYYGLARRIQAMVFVLVMLVSSVGLPAVAEDTATQPNIYGMVQTRKLEEKQLTASLNGDSMITVTYGQSAQIPDGAQLVVTPVVDEAPYVQQAKKDLNVKSVDFVQLFDMGIYYDGAKIEPANKVKISFRLTEDMKRDGDLRIVHFPTDPEPITSQEAETAPAVASKKMMSVKGTKAAPMTVEPQDDDDDLMPVQAASLDTPVTEELNLVLNEENIVSFETYGFSVFGVCYTVDFVLNGIQFSMPGGGALLLSELFNNLGINIKTEEVDYIEFSDPALLSVEKIPQDTTVYAMYLADYAVDEGDGDFTIGGSGSFTDKAVQAGDWLMRSLVSFTSEETLTVYLKNGEKLVINVTDPEDPNNPGYWQLNNGQSLDQNDINTENASELTYSVSTVITGTPQDRDISFSLTVNYTLTDTALAEMKGYHGGYPVIVYDLTQFVENNPIDISDASGRIRDTDGYTQVGEYEIIDGKAYLKITNLDWLRQRSDLTGVINLRINVHEEEVITEDHWTFHLPGIDEDVVIPFKPIDYHVTKTVAYNGTNNYNGPGVFLTEENGYYYLNYTASISNPSELDSLTFIDTLRGNQILDADSVKVNGNSVTVASQTTGSDATGDYKQFTVNMPAGSNGKVAQGDYTVTYRTQINPADVKDYTQDDIEVEINKSDWKANGTKDIPGPTTSVQPVVPTPTPAPTPIPGGQTIDKTVNGKESDTSTMGRTLNYVVVFGEAADPDNNKLATNLSGAVISDYMTDNQKLIGNITITYADGTTETMPVASNGQWDGGVKWNDDGQYGAYNTDLFCYSLPAGTVGPVTVTYQTQIISKEEAIAAGIWNSTESDNTAKLGNLTDTTTVTAEMPSEPTIEKKVNDVAGDAGQVNPGATLNYTLTYGSADVKLAGTTITDYMTALQNLTTAVTITLADNTFYTMPTAPNGYDTGAGVVWNANNSPTFNGSYQNNELKLFDYTFTESVVGDKTGPVTITYSTVALSQSDYEQLNLFGLQDIRNRFSVNNKTAETVVRVQTQTPTEVTKVIQDGSGNAITTVNPGDTVTYTVSFGTAGQNMGGYVLRDWMSDIQTVESDITFTFGDGTSYTLTRGDNNNGYRWNGSGTNPWNEPTVFEYTVPEGKTGVITATYQAKLADKETLNNLGIYGELHAKNHATSDHGGNGNTDIPGDYGDKPEMNLVKTGEYDSGPGSATEWQPSTRIKWTITFGDSTTDMRNKTLEDNMTFQQKLDETAGVTVTVGENGTPTPLPAATDRWNGYGVVYQLDDHVNSSDYSDQTVPVFRYKVADGENPIYGPITFVYYTTVIDQTTEAWPHGIYDWHNVKNTVWADGKYAEYYKDVNFDHPPEPTAEKKAYTGADQATAEAMGTLHENGYDAEHKYELGSFITYEMTYGNEYTLLDGLWVSDEMTNVQTLVSDVEYKINDGPWTVMPTAASGNPAVDDGVKWSFTHQKDADGQDIFNNNNLRVFSWRVPAGSGYGTITFRYTVRVMTNEEALAQGLVFSVTNTNYFAIGSNYATTYGPVIPEVPPVNPDKTVTPEDDDVAGDGWQPGDTLSYTLTYGYNGQWVNNPSNLVNIYDKMTDLQKLPGDITVTYYTDAALTTTDSFVMPIATNENYNNGVRWQNDSTYSTDMKDVFNYNLPKPDENKPGTETPIGKMYGPITVTYDTQIISADEALEAMIWGEQTVYNLFMNSEQTEGTVPFTPEPIHNGHIQKTAYINKVTGDPVYIDANQNSATWSASNIPDTAIAHVIMQSHQVVWYIRVTVANDGSSYPLSNMTVEDNNGRYQQDISAGYGQNTGGNIKDILNYESARVVGDSGKVYMPGEDYTFTPSTYRWFFPELTEPITIMITADFPEALVGNYLMNNTASLWWDNTHEDAFDNVEGSVEKIIANKSGEYDSNTRVVKWTAVLNPGTRLYTPDIDRVILKDDLPVGFELINYSSYYDSGTIDTSNPTVQVKYLGNEYSRTEYYSVNAQGNHFEVDITKYNVTDDMINWGSYSSIVGQSTDGGVYYWGPKGLTWYPIEDVPEGAYCGLLKDDAVVTALVGVNNQKYQVTYYTRVSDEAWREVTSSETGSQVFTNTVLFTDNSTASWGDTAHVEVKAQNPLHKYELKEYNNEPTTVIENEGDAKERLYWYRVDLNENREQLTKRINGELQTLTITDYIDPKIDLIQGQVKLYRVEADGVTKTDTATLTGSDKVTIQYNDDSRILKIENLQDETWYCLEYEVRVRAQYTEGMSEEEYTIRNTITLEGSRTWTETVTQKHMTVDNDFTAGGHITVTKVDENDLSVKLAGAKFNFYRQPTNVTVDASTNPATITGDGTFEGEAVLLNQDGPLESDSDGKITLPSHITFEQQTLYYWQEVEAPSGYILDDTPHYFVLYSETNDGVTVSSVPRDIAWALDNLWTSANHIVVASMSFGTPWIATNSKSRSITVTKRWADDYNNVYKTRPDTIKVNLIQIDYQGNRTVLKSTIMSADDHGDWLDYTNYMWTGLPAHEPGNASHPYTYTVEEEDVSGYVAVYSDDQAGINSGKITITNKLIPSKTNIYLEKKWNNAETANLPDQITVTLQQIHKDADGNVGAPAPATTIPGYLVTLTPDSEGHWTYEWTNLPTRDGQGGEYTYTVKETVPEGFIVVYSDDNHGVVESTSANPLVITNTAVGSLKVTKSFTGFTPGSLTQAQKQAIQFTVKNSAEETVAQFTYADMLGGEKTIENLPAGVYTVTEEKAAGSDDEDYFWQEATYTVNGAAAPNNQVLVLLNQTVTVGLNNRPKSGALRITKAVTVDGNPTTTNLADGTYSFTITGPNYNQTESITVTNGAAQSSIELTDLTPGEYTITEGASTNGTTLSVRSGDETGTDGDRGIKLTVEAGDTAETNVAAFTNNINTTSLSISKTVVSPVPADSTKTFTFTVAVTKADGTALTGTFGEYTFNASGQTTVTTTGTDTVTISGLPQGAAWTVTETTDNDFTASQQSATGTLTAETATAAFTNTRKTGSLTVTKALQGKGEDAAPTGTYTYPIKVTTIVGDKTYYVTESSGTYSLTETVTQLSVTNGNTLTINNLPVSNNGTALTYKVEEVDPGSVAVTDYTNVNVTGTTVETVENIAVTETTAGTANLVNVYERDKGSLKIQKTVQLNGQNTTDAKLDGTYTFTVVSADGVTPATSKTVAMTFSSGTDTTATIRNTSDDEASATALTVTDGTVQIDGLPTGSYTVAEDTNSLTNGISLLGTNDQTINVAKDQTSGIPTAYFTNNKPYVTQTPVVTKKLNGVDFTGTNGAGTVVLFEFTLKKVIIGGTDENPTYTVDSGAALQTVTTETNGSISFNAIEFTQAGSYIFQIAETGRDSDTMDYADPIYVKIEVTESSGVLTAAEPAYYSDIECTQSLTNATFENTELTQISAKKTWSGSDLWPDNMSVTFDVEQYKGEARQTEFAKTAAENGNVTSVTIASQETVNWTHLPKYYLNDSDQVQPYTYKVVETAMLYNNTALTDYRTYYTVTGEGEGENGIVTIDNTPKTTSIKVTKEWKRSNDPVKNRESISYTLYKKYAQTTESVNVTAAQLAADPGTAEVGKVKYVSENDSWQTVTISNLPKYERVVTTTEGGTTTITYSPISYYVVESNAAADPGYVLTTAYRADNGAETTAEGAAVNTNDATITIINTETSGVELPSTGGPGTAAYLAGGIALMALALILAQIRRKRGLA